mmetsp:Transcript_18659/g.53794  ORF Transcript_18659/g.53794 Transcript_18659/m.53794 type:complete len:257 (-) Transcript_18659:441-1211(-)
MLHRILDQFLQVALHVLQSTDIVPGHVGHLHHCLSQAGRVGHTQSVTEVILIDRHRIQNLSIDLLILNVDQIHLFADALHGRLSTQRGNVSAHKTVRLACDRLGIHILVELHVAGMDAEHLETSILVRHANVDLAIESSEATESRVHRIGTVGSTNDHHGSALFQSVHEGEKLRHNSTLDLSIGLVTLGSNGIDLVDKDDGGRILLGLLERFAQVRLRFSRHLGHDLGTVDQKEERTSLVGNRTGDEGLSRTGGTI